MKFSLDSRDYTCFEDVVMRLQNSNDPEVKDHYFWGVDTQGAIKLLHSFHVKSHCQFLGGTGMGKTALAMLSLIVQLLLRKVAAISVFDFKGDQFLFRTVGETARRTRVNLKYFTAESDRATYGFYPLRQPSWLRLSLEERVQVVLTALGLESGEADPNTAYFAGVNEAFIRGLLTLCPEARTFGELYQLAIDPTIGGKIGMDRRAVEHAGAVIANLSRLANIPQINDGPPSVLRAAIDIRECLESVTHTYFRLPAQRIPTAGRAIARLFVTLLMAEARAMGKAPVWQVLAIDEFQHVAQRGFIDLLKQARNLSTSCYVGHQNLSDLDMGAQSMLDAVVGNTNVRVMLSATDTLSRKHLKEASVRVARLMRSATKTVTESGDGTTSVGTSDSLAEVLEEKISAEVMAKVNGTSGLAIVEAYPNKGLTQLNGPELLYLPQICSAAEYERREAAPWPAPNEFTMLGDAPPEGESPSFPPPTPPGDDPPDPPPPIAPAKPRPPRKPRSRSIANEATSSQPPAEESQKPSSLGQYLLSLTENEP